MMPSGAVDGPPIGSPPAPPSTARRRPPTADDRPGGPVDADDAPPPPSSAGSSSSLSFPPRRPRASGSGLGSGGGAADAPPPPLPPDDDDAGTAAAVVRVGIGVLVRDPRHRGKVFAGLRINSHGDGTLALPGGHLEMYESWEACAMREAMEETGLALRNVTFGHVTNDIMAGEGRHYVTIIMMAECADGDAVPRNLEPHKCGGWRSYSWEELRERAGAGRGGGGRGGGPGDDDDDGDESGGGGGLGPALFGPLSKLVEDAPRNVLDFINKSS